MSMVEDLICVTDDIKTYIKEVEEFTVKVKLHSDAAVRLSLPLIIFTMAI